MGSTLGRSRRIIPLCWGHSPWRRLRILPKLGAWSTCGFGKEQLWHGQRRVMGLGQAGVKRETLLWEGRVEVIQAALGWR